MKKLLLLLLLPVCLCAQTIRPTFISQLRLTQLTTAQEAGMTLQEGDVWENITIGCIRYRLASSTVCIAEAGSAASGAVLLNPTGSQAILDFNLSTPILNNIRVVDGNKFTTIAAAVSDLPSRGGTVFVPSSESGNTFAGFTTDRPVRLVFDCGDFTFSSAVTWQRGSFMEGCAPPAQNPDAGTVLFHDFDGDFFTWTGDPAQAARGTGGGVRNIRFMNSSGIDTDPGQGDALKLRGTNDNTRPGAFSIENVEFNRTSGLGFWTRNLHIDGTGTTDGVKNIWINRFRGGATKQDRETILLNFVSGVKAWGVATSTSGDPEEGILGVTVTAPVGETSSQIRFYALRTQDLNLDRVQQSFFSGEFVNLIDTANTGTNSSPVVVDAYRITNQPTILGVTFYSRPVGDANRMLETNWQGIAARVSLRFDSPAQIDINAGSALGVRFNRVGASNVPVTVLESNTATANIIFNGNATGGFLMRAIALASLPSSPNGTFIFCSDCLRGSGPCTASSTGAFAKRENGAWNCD